MIHQKVGAWILVGGLFLGATVLSVVLPEKAVNAEIQQEVDEKMKTNNIAGYDSEGLLFTLGRNFGRIIEQTEKNDIDEFLGSMQDQSLTISSGLQESQTIEAVIGQGQNIISRVIRSDPVNDSIVRSYTVGPLMKNCTDTKFTDIFSSDYLGEIIYVHNLCIVAGKGGKYHPDNYVRVFDLFSALAQAYGNYFISETETRNVQSLPLISTDPSKMDIIAYANLMKILVYFWDGESEFDFNAFVTVDQIPRIRRTLHGLEPRIGISRIEDFPKGDGIVTRELLAFSIAHSFDDFLSIPYEELIQSYNQDEQSEISGRQRTRTQVQSSELEQVTSSNLSNTGGQSEMTDTDRETFGLGILEKRGIIAKDSPLFGQATQPIRRDQFLILLVQTLNYKNPAIPISVPYIPYFSDYVTTGNSTITQSKNLGLTSFFEITRRGEIFLEPESFVTQFEASRIINTAFGTNLAATQSMDAVLIKTDTVAQMIAIAQGWQLPVSINEDRVKLDDIRNSIRKRSNRFFQNIHR